MPRDKSEKTASPPLPPQPRPNYLKWRAPAHPHRNKTAYELKEAALRVGILVLIAVFFKQFLLAAVIIAFAFLVYAVSLLEPEEVINKLDKNGVTTGGDTYIWEDLDYFYFTDISGLEVLNIETLGIKPSRIMLMLGEMDKERVREFMEDYLPYRSAPESSVLERAARRLSRWLHLD